MKRTDKSAYEKAAELLNYRMMSEGELEDKLLSRGYEAKEISPAIERLRELGLLNDSEYAGAVVRSCARKGWGAARARQELFRRKIPKELFEEALSELPEDSSEAIMKYVSSHLKDPEDEAQVNKTVSGLLRRGFSFEEIRSALNESEK